VLHCELSRSDTGNQILEKNSGLAHCLLLPHQPNLESSFGNINLSEFPALVKVGSAFCFCNHSLACVQHLETNLEHNVGLLGLGQLLVQIQGTPDADLEEALSLLGGSLAPRFIDLGLNLSVLLVAWIATWVASLINTNVATTGQGNL